ncbi:MAG: transglycosylase SLT domain-containing protein [Elusimicrobia bacterium]|nr:transglycosylase SLT domain-containing protein [Elusimicrobiota bacterium]
MFVRIRSRSQVLLFLRLVPVILAVAAAAQAPGDPNSVDDAESGVLSQLKRAERSYGEALADFRSEREEEARAHLRRAFLELSDSLTDESLVNDARADFLAIVEKVRTFDGAAAPPEEERPTGLDADPAALAAVSPAAPVVGRDERHAIRIDSDNETVQRYIALYTGKESRRRAVEEALGRAELYKPMMTAALRKAGLPEELFWLVMTESEFKMKAVSGAGAAGLWQFIPGSARNYGLEVSYWVDERFNPEKATQAALRYLKDLKVWVGDWHLALAAYNRGENGVGRDLQWTRSTDFAQLAGRGALPNETQAYVPKFMACVLIGEHPERYGLKPASEAPEPFDTVRVERDLDLSVAAKCAGTTEEVLRRLNPELRAWCTPKGRPYSLKVPAGSRESFLAALAEVKDWNPGPQVVVHRVQRGEYLGKIAKRYRTTVRAIMNHNSQIKNARSLRPGMVLRIPPGKGFIK